MVTFFMSIMQRVLLYWEECKVEFQYLWILVFGISAFWYRLFWYFCLNLSCLLLMSLSETAWLSSQFPHSCRCPHHPTLSQFPHSCRCPHHPTLSQFPHSCRCPHHPTLSQFPHSCRYPHHPTLSQFPHSCRCPHHPTLRQTQFFINWDWLLVLCGKGLSFNHFMLLKGLHFIKNQLIMLLMLFEVILCFSYWFFTISVNRILVLHWKWLLMFVSLLVMVLWVPFYHTCQDCSVLLETGNIAGCYIVTCSCHWYIPQPPTSGILDPCYEKRFDGLVSIPWRYNW